MISFEYPAKTQETSVNLPTPNPSILPLPTPTSIPSPTLVLIKTPPPKAIPTPTPIKQPLPVLNGGNIFGLVNAYRQQNGLPPWTVSDELCRIAEMRADFMISNNLEAFKTSNTGSHTGFGNRFDDYNYSGDVLGENLAAWITSDGLVLTAWKSSPAHNSLLLETITEQNVLVTKACVATRVKEYGSIVVLLAGDK